MSQIPDPRDVRIEELEREVQKLKLNFEMKFGNDENKGTLVTLLSSMACDLKDMKLAMFGDPRDSQSIGLLVRIDRIEQWAGQAKWVIGSSATAIIGEIVWLVFHR